MGLYLKRHTSYRRGLHESRATLRMNKVDLCPFLEKQRYYVGEASSGSVHQRCNFLRVLELKLGASFYEQTGNVCVAVSRGDDKRTEASVG